MKLYLGTSWSTVQHKRQKLKCKSSQRATGRNISVKIADFSVETMKAKKQWNDIQVL